MNKDLIAVFEYLEREKGIGRKVVINAIEESLTIAARKSIDGASNVTVSINQKTGKIDVFSEKEIVDVVEVPAQEISLEEAREIDPQCEIGQFIDVVVTPSDFGRIAAQKARQIINQKIRSAERDVIYEEYRHRVNELVSGTVKRFARGANLIVDLGKVEAILPMRHYPKTERYNVGDRVFALLFEVRDTDIGGAEVVLSRTEPEFVRQLIHQEVPEVSEGTVEVVSVFREPGYRTKFTVRSFDSKVDPVGACVGVRGTRVKNIVSELNNEKVDIIPYSDDPIELLQNALDPIEIRKVRISEQDKVCSIVVDDDDYPKVIGKRGLNARLNSQLIGYDLEIKPMTEYTKTIAVERKELAESEDPILDQPIEKIEGVNQLIVDHLIDGEFTTYRSLLQATSEELAKKANISLVMADNVLDQVRKQVQLTND